jgi:hypothetical protein
MNLEENHSRSLASEHFTRWTFLRSFLLWKATGRHHFCLEAILRKAPRIQGDDEIGLALLSAETEGIVLGVG